MGPAGSLMVCAWPSLVEETSQSMSMTLSSMALWLGCCCIVLSSTATIAGPSCSNGKEKGVQHGPGSCASLQV